MIELVVGMMERQARRKDGREGGRERRGGVT